MTKKGKINEFVGSPEESSSVGIKEKNSKKKSSSLPRDLKVSFKYVASSYSSFCSNIVQKYYILVRSSLFLFAVEKAFYYEFEFSLHPIYQMI